MVQEGPQTPEDRSTTPKMASRRPKRPPRWPKKHLRGLQKGPQEAKIVDFPLVFEGFWRSRIFSFRRSKTPQEAPKTAPRPPQDGPRGLQEGPQTAQDGPKTAQEASKTAQYTPKTAPREGTDGGPERAFRHLCPKRPLGGPKRPPRGPRRPQKHLQQAPERPPKRPHEASQRGVLSTTRVGPKNTPRSHRETASSSSSSPLHPPPPPPPPTSSRSPRTHKHIAPAIQCGPAE